MAKYLLDTHVFIWYANGDKRLSQKALDIVDSENERLISIATIWEMAIKVSLGKLIFKKEFKSLVNEQIKINDLKILNLAPDHIFSLVNLPFHHRDPFDRLLIAQAKTEDIPVVSVDHRFDAYDIQRIW